MKKRIDADRTGGESGRRMYIYRTVQLISLRGPRSLSCSIMHDYVIAWANQEDVVRHFPDIAFVNCRPLGPDIYDLLHPRHT